MDDVYEKISDEELDFFDEENSKSQTPVSLLDMDWSALAAIGPAAKKGQAKLFVVCFSCDDPCHVTALFIS